MTDAEGQVKEYLLSGVGDTLALAALVGDLVYIDVDLPVGYTLQQGDAVVFKTRSGPGVFHSHSLNPSMQFLTFAQTRDKAAEIYRALYAALNDKQTSYFKMAYLETEGQLLRRVGGLYYYLSFWRFWIGNP